MSKGSQLSEEDASDSDAPADPSKPKLTFADLMDKERAPNEHEKRLRRLTLGAEEYLKECAKEILPL